MVMDILGVVATGRADAVVQAEAVLAKRWDARAALLHVTLIPDPVADSSGYGGDIYALTVSDAQEQGAAEQKALAARVQDISPNVTLRQAESMRAGAETRIAVAAMASDLVVIERADNPERRLVLEAVLFRSGRPLLMLPSDWRGDSIGKRILIAWAPKREASRALADATPFLHDAEAVRIASVDLKANIDGTETSAADMASFLTQRGVKAEARMIDGRGRSHEEALLEEARAFNADLIVMGGYGHSRFREFVFGGVTRVLSEASPVPVLMSH